MASSTVATDNWDPKTYSTTVAPFVPKLTTRVISLLAIQPDDIVLDLGCGDGVLTHQLSKQCTHITGIDSSPSMISGCPSSANTVYICSPALSLPAELPHAQYTKLFSNAALHWILRCPAASRSQFFKTAYSLLRPGGAFVAECGGFGNVADVHVAVIAALVHRGIPPQTARESSPWWFGSVGEYRSLLEEAGFEVEVLETELRQTELTVGEGGGVGGWVRLFAAEMLKVLPQGEREGAVREVEEVLEGVGRRGDGGLWVNYIRLRFVARKPVA
ncbi:S-adenosyl-L-methionine-dependent methyltransferase [Sphaerosporella brunnea]|uniref:S-adenosyl-L-methionine-dependent methyltransferase n=1 Tax=Sphaerosporella brunnea TaxID=1250544 RepID=A0A5J5EBU2_9PEZI|nr:S-adenosyl-L-methionine-dependent methyltransferase [Sphaerosporella brunnea]